MVDLFVVNVTLLQKMFTPPLHCSLLRCAWYDNHLLQINLTIVIPGASYPAHGSISLLVFSWSREKGFAERYVAPEPGSTSPLRRVRARQTQNAILPRKRPVT